MENKRYMVFIWLFAKSTYKSDKHYFESNYGVIANALISNENDIEISRIYPKENNCETCLNLLNVNDDE